MKVCWFVITSIMTSELLTLWEGDQTGVCLWEEMIHWGDTLRISNHLLALISLHWVKLTVTSLNIPGLDDSSVPPASGFLMTGSLISRLYESCYDHYTASNLAESQWGFSNFHLCPQFYGSIKLKAHDAFFVLSPSTCRPLRMEVVERQQGRKLRNAHLRRSANYEESSRAEQAEEANHRVWCREVLRSSSKLPLPWWCYSYFFNLSLKPWLYTSTRPPTHISMERCLF